VAVFRKPVKVIFREANTKDTWLEGEIPGSVHTDLLKRGRIPDPFVADNELQVQWVAERDWLYKVTFPVDTDLLKEERVFLVCDGIDTLSEVSIGDHILSHTNNMFRRYQWDITEFLTDDEITIQFLFSSIVKYMQEKQAEYPLIGPSQSIPGGPYVRKAPCQFGWDWGPQLPPMGFWKDMRLEGYSIACLDDVAIDQHHDGAAVSVSANITLNRWQSGACKASLTLESPGGEKTKIDCVVRDDDTQFQLSLEVKDPQLWWPNGYGAQPLYDVSVHLFEGDKTLDIKHYQIGLHTVALHREPDAYGTSFTFVINDIPIFAKGANWIPADSFPTRITDSNLEHLIRSAAEANMNMLRVWGGGFYEEDRFYDMCDRYGVLVWQDFAFSCSVYPGDEDFLENVRLEAIQNIRRLRHRASLALWCGNNEMEWGWVNWGWTQRMPAEFKKYYDDMFHKILPDICAKEDPGHPYWPSSPSSGVPFQDPGGVDAGDTHNWQVWHGGQPFEQYREHNSRFVSEFGFQSLPPLSTIKTYAEEQDWNMTSYMMEHHQRNASGNGKIINYMTDHFRLPKDFLSLVYLTQLLQAEAVRTGVEYWRRNRECTSGALYWQLNDCWPVASWASLDYFGRWKALHYSAKRFYAPLLLTAEEKKVDVSSGSTTHNTGYLFQPKPGPFMQLYLASDLTEKWNGTVRWSLETLQGQVIKSDEVNVAVDPLSATSVLALDFEADIHPDNERDVIFVYELLNDVDRLSIGVHTFVPSKHLSLTEPHLSTTFSEGRDGFWIDITAKSLARFVWLQLEEIDVVFGDNFFDVPAGRTVKVWMPKIADYSLYDIQNRMSVTSLIDTY
jgi:beta-mannosidase